MTKPLRHRKCEIENAGRIARELGLAVRLEPNGAITFIPDTHRPTFDNPDEDDLDRELEAFEARHADG